MPRRFVRESKFRHVYGEPYKRKACYENLNVSKHTWDGGNLCASNSKFLAVALEGHGGGCFVVIPQEKTGRLENDLPKYAGHRGSILDIQFNPFNANVVATASEDSRIKIWEIPESALTEDLNESAIDLIGHRKKVGIIRWHPSANNVLASAGFDYDVIIWDVEKGSPVHVISCHDDIINSLSWNKDGSLLISACKDKFIRLLNPRSEEVIHKFKAHAGSKPSRAFFVDDDRLVTVGCTKDATREIALWNVNNLEETIKRTDLDQGSGNLLAMYDDLLNILYIAAKGDCIIRYYEISKESPYLHYLSQYVSNTPQRCFGILPKRALSVNSCEIFRMYKVHPKGLCEPLSMIVPRKSDSYQADIYPNVPGDTPALSSEQWFSGEDMEPLLINLAKGFKAAKKEFQVSYQPVEDNIFAVHMAQAPKREEDLRKAFYQQQDEIKTLREKLKAKELRLRQLDYENAAQKKEVVIEAMQETKTTKRKQVSSMVEESDCSDASSDGDCVTELVEQPEDTIVKVIEEKESDEVKEDFKEDPKESNENNEVNEEKVPEIVIETYDVVGEVSSA